MSITLWYEMSYTTNPLVDDVIIIIDVSPIIVIYDARNLFIFNVYEFN
jgi:hypothetical protein